MKINPRQEFSARVRDEIARHADQLPGVPSVRADELLALALRYPRFSRMAELLKIADTAGGAHVQR